MDLVHEINSGNRRALARLLTLMYQAPTPELEDYIRHTLQDLKTLTRGLAAAEHRLSHAAVEWKADLSHRLAAAQAELAWSFQSDRDLHLTVVQWSALTRVLRELVSNALYHGHATAVEVLIQLERGQLLLRVADDGGGRADPGGRRQCTRGRWLCSRPWPERFRLTPTLVDGT